MNFKIGDRVKIHKDSEGYRFNDPSNPQCGGVVVEINNEEKLYIRVQWGIECYNAYTDADLEYYPFYVFEQLDVL